MDGSEFCRCVRQDERHRDIAIILCTGKMYELDVEQITEESRLSKVISKPFSPQGLAALVRRTLAD